MNGTSYGVGDTGSSELEFGTTVTGGVLPYTRLQTKYLRSLTQLRSCRPVTRLALRSVSVQGGGGGALNGEHKYTAHSPQCVAFRSSY